MRARRHHQHAAGAPSKSAGVEKIDALVGGFHLAPAPDDYLRQVMAELKKFDLEHVMPMHCSGQNFINLAAKEMPEKLVIAGPVAVSHLPHNRAASVTPDAGGNVCRLQAA